MSDRLVGKPTKFGEMIPATCGVVIWLVVLIGQGPTAALETIWLMLLAVPLAAWTLLMRLRLSDGRLLFTVGPWRRVADLTALESIAWKMTGGWRSRGTIFVRDRQGGRIPIYVGRFSGVDEWARCFSRLLPRARRPWTGSLALFSKAPGAREKPVAA